MRVLTIGGGPGGLYSGILLKKAFPEAEIRVVERNQADDTFGWGVVFSDETLSGFEEADAESFREIRSNFAYWSDIETFYPGGRALSTGHGFCGLSRKKLLNILHDRCRELGVELEFGVEVDELEPYDDYDLIIAADGVNSAIRERHADVFKPSTDWRKCKFSWLGTTKPLEAFTFVFKENEHGLFTVHAYPFDRETSTWIVECREETFQAAGLESASEADTVAYCSELFKEELEGHELLTNRSMWRTFPTVRCERWAHENIVLLGDSAHTAHFSIGSGTKLAMEDATALVEAFRAHGDADIPATLAAYQESRRVDVIKLQKAAQTSLEWFENAGRYVRQTPAQFQFNLMTRSKRITYENLKLRDPELVARADEEFRLSQGAELASDGVPAPPAFTPLKVGGLELKNRIVVSPMCQYSATEGLIDDWHLVHLGSRALGGAGLIITEMTDVSADGRITPGCAGLYTDEHTAAWKRVVDFCHERSDSKIGIQLAHAGRKGSTSHAWDNQDEPLTDGAWQTMGPDDTPFREGWPAPKQMDRADMDRVRDEFVASTERALEAGFDLVELHMAHGYLLSSFLSPLSNSRADEYGGSLENRLRYPLEVLEAVRAAWPKERPLACRISASDWHPEGLTVDDAVEISKALHAAGCDLIDVSSAGNSLESEPVYGRMYQVPFAERIKHETDALVMAVGAIQGADHANTVLAAGRADLCALARPHLADPYLTLHAASRYDYPDQPWPGQYLMGKPRLEPRGE
ncbi:MAG: bifunctional salicylyl-CoA 5-hydroxylase/oxidoreductase [Planctomycetes bacterium]|nr:bifunctional salicylyl-CoA 5-hydroxylase/oxidoreductase [Planctomycetota bacterium]